MLKVLRNMIFEKRQMKQEFFCLEKINLGAVSFYRSVVLKLCYIFESYEVFLSILMSSPHPIIN